MRHGRRQFICRLVRIDNGRFLQASERSAQAELATFLTKAEGFVSIQKIRISQQSVRQLAPRGLSCHR